MFAAKVQQKNEQTKYFGKKVQILYKKWYNTDINIYDVQGIVQNAAAGWTC